MKVVDLLERRRPNWQELDRLCEQLQGKSTKSVPPAQISRLGALYRAACADLALAYSYQLPQNTVQYLHRLVGRAHNQLYRSRRFEFAKWIETLIFDVPKTIFNDRCVQIMFCVFWLLFGLSAALSYSKTAWPDFPEQVLTQKQIDKMETDFGGDLGRDADANMIMAGFYISNNTGIGLQCFAWGLLVVPGLLITMFNAITLGASFGYMFRDVSQPPGKNFMEFVTAHGPFELTAIVLSAGAGLRLGLSWMITKGLSRGAALRKAGREVMPVVGTAMVLFFLAALIEGFISPTKAPYWVKVAVALISGGLMTVYFIVLGFPDTVRRPPRPPADH